MASIDDIEFPTYIELETETRGVNGYLIIEPDNDHYTLALSDLTNEDNDATVTIPVTLDAIRELHLKLTAFLLGETAA